MENQEKQSIYQINKNIHFNPCIQEQANCISKFFFIWTNSLVTKGAKKSLEMDDLFDIVQNYFPKQSYQRFDQIFTSLKSKTPEKMKVSLKKFVRRSFIYYCILVVLAYSMIFAGPLVVSNILNYLAKPNEPIQTGIFWVSLLVLANLIKTFTLQHALHILNGIAVAVMNTATSKIFHKILLLSNSSRKYLQTGAIMNYINVDVQAFQFFLLILVHLIGAPLLIIIAIVFIIIQVGWIGVSAPAILFISFYLQQIIITKGVYLRKDQLFWADKRSKCINQYFSGIRIIKYYGWEDIISNQIEAIRKQQLKLIFRGVIYRGYMQLLMNMAPVITSLIVFGVFVFINGEEKLTPSVVYTCLSLFTLISNPMRLLVMTLVQYINVKTGLTRIDHFLQYADIVTEGVNHNDQDLQIGQIKIQNGKFNWQNQISKQHFEAGKKLYNKNQTKLNNKEEVINKNKKEIKKRYNKKDGEENLEKKIKSSMNQDVYNTSNFLKAPLLSHQQILINKNHDLIIHDLHIEPKEFIGVIGQVGSGKSTLLNAILNQIDKAEGTVRRRGSIAYISQTSWLRSATIKQNILFQEEYNQEKYKKIINLCQLENDLLILGGDLTQVGERGVNLSGGQKQRLAIARALYADADIYLIDDCLSALDSYVSKKIFYRVIKQYLKNKTIIFVTHAVHLVHECDRIIVMKNGKIQECGTYQQLSSKKDSEFNNLEIEYQKKQEQQRKSRKKDSEDLIDIAENKIDRERQQLKINKFQNLVKVEERERGSVPWKIYFRFFIGGGGLLSLSMLFFSIFAQFSRVVGDWWLGTWSINTFRLSTNQYLWIYSLICLSFAILLLVKNYVYGKFIIKTSQSLQRQLISALLSTPLFWFDITPTGRILARTTKDQDDIDNNFGMNLHFSLLQFIVLTFSILLIGITTPFYLVVIFVCICIYFKLYKYYTRTAVQLKRLQANTRAPLISHIQETINGIYIIRAFKKCDIFIEKFFKLQKNYIVVYSNQNMAIRWISLITDIFASIIVTGSIYFEVFKIGPIYSNFIGLSLTWSLSVSFSIGYLLRALVDIQNNMNSVVRMLQYIENNPKEKDFKLPEAPQGWPHEGKMQFKNITYRYRKQLQNVIHGISFDVQKNAKIGVVGRTGSGKSTLTLGILRILQLTEDQDGNKGEIILDNVNIENLGLHNLRQKVTIIPQDPILFNGTIRSNIDPFNLYKDQQIVEALKKVEIWDQIRINDQEKTEIDKKLHSKVDGFGANFSLGQRQLICMARALVRNPKILLMDEATASIDQKTDSLIQKMIRKQFKQTTVITIAHRLNTIVNYDKILVLDYGKIKEYGKPLQLIQDQSSFLGNLIKETGKQYQEKITRLAQKTIQQIP